MNDSVSTHYHQEEILKTHAAAAEKEWASALTLKMKLITVIYDIF